MGLDNLLATLEKRGSITPVTSVTLDDVTPKPAWIEACTPVTPVTSKNDITANDEAAIIAPPEPSEIDKPETLQDRKQEARRQKVIAMLDTAPNMPRAIHVDDSSDLHNIILCVAVRHPTRATCEMLIPKAKYDPFALLELLMQHETQNAH